MTSPVLEPVPPGPPGASPFVRLPLHGGLLRDGFWDGAAGVRRELLGFPAWKPMRLGSAYGFQTCITTGHIEGRFPELGECHRFESHLARMAPEICRACGADPTPPLHVVISGMAYGQGGQLKVHSDYICGRRVAWILYLTHPDEGPWTDRDGGHLVLVDEQSGVEVPVFPAFNRFVAFRVSQTSFHRIEPVRRDTAWERSRLALTGWIVEHLPQDP